MNREQRFFINKLRTLLSKIDRSKDIGGYMSKDMEYVTLQVKEIIDSFDDNLGVMLLTDVEIEGAINDIMRVDANNKEFLENYFGEAMYHRDSKYYYVSDNGTYPLNKVLLRKAVTYLIDLIENVQE